MSNKLVAYFSASGVTAKVAAFDSGGVASGPLTATFIPHKCGGIFLLHFPWSRRCLIRKLI